MTQSLRDAKREATRRALAETTYRMVRARGFDQVTIDEITTEVNVSRRTFSNYFANKEEAVAFVPVDRIRTELEKWEAPAGIDAAAAVRSVVAHLLASGLPMMLAELGRLGRRHPPFGPHSREVQWAVWDAVRERLHEVLHIDAPRDRRNLAMLLGALYGIVSTQLADLDLGDEGPGPEVFLVLQESVGEVFTLFEPALRRIGQ